MTDKRISRRTFVGDSARAAAGVSTFMIVPPHVLGRGRTPPSRMLNIAIVGGGGMGGVNAEQLVSENLVAFCDVDPNYMTRRIMGSGNETQPPSPARVQLREKFQKATKYTDFREMLARQRDLDAVLVATPDHTHAVIAAAAMRARKHVYVQKPLAWSVYESRLLARLSRENRVVTQMGNQGHSNEGTRRIVEWMRAGVIGDVREVHIFTDRPARFWAQGLPRPARPAVMQAGAPAAAPAAAMARGNVSAMRTALAQAMAAADATPPEGLRWDLFLGPVAEDIPYHPVYHPFTWRGWVDFGVGALGDMGAHLMDQAYWALELTQPTSIEATSSLWGTETVPPPAGSPPDARPTVKQVSYPMATTVHYNFPANGRRPPVKLNWYDGGLYPPRPDHLPDEVQLVAEGGGLFIGDKGLLIHENYGDNPRLFPVSVAEAGMAVPRSLQRITESHEMNWVKACKGEGAASCPFEYAAGLNEAMLLGIAALRAGQGRKLYYDAEAMAFTNGRDANQFLTREYRKGWEL